MIAELSLYLLRVSVIWAVLLAFYALTQRNNGNWLLRRRLLLGSYVLGLLLPLLPAISVPVAVQSFSISGRLIVDNPVIQSHPTPVTYFTWPVVLAVLYFKVALFVGVSKVLLLARSLMWKYTEPRTSHGRFSIIHHPKVKSPFAAWGCIYLPDNLRDGELYHTALAHETYHLRMQHPLEQLLLLPGSILLWFHPLQWVFNRWQSDLHEYEVDAAMVETMPAKTYALQLIQSSLSMGSTWPPRFFSSSLKKRIYRMTNLLTSRSFQPGQFFALLGLILFLAVACSDLKEDLTTTTPDFASPFELVFTEQFPRLITDDPADATKSSEQLLLEAIYGQVKYPKEAREIGLMGNFQVTVIVESDGSAKVNSVCSILPEAVDSDKQLVVMGYGKPSTKFFFGTDEEINLLYEVHDLMDNIGPFIPSVKEGVAARSLIHFYLTFELEEN